MIFKKKTKQFISKDITVSNNASSDIAETSEIEWKKYPTKSF